TQRSIGGLSPAVLVPSTSNRVLERRAVERRRSSPDVGQTYHLSEGRPMSEILFDDRDVALFDLDDRAHIDAAQERVHPKLDTMRDHAMRIITDGLGWDATSVTRVARPMNDRDVHENKLYNEIYVGASYRKSRTP